MKTVRKQTTISLNSGEAAFTWKLDGSHELYLPGHDDDDDLEVDSPFFQAICIAVLFGDGSEATELRERLGELVAREIDEVESSD